jgi:hypothetical protein
MSLPFNMDEEILLQVSCYFEKPKDTYIGIQVVQQLKQGGVRFGLWETSCWGGGGSVKTLIIFIIAVWGTCENFLI